MSKSLFIVIQNKCVARREESPGREYGRWTKAELFLSVLHRLNMTFVIEATPLATSHKASTRWKIPSFVIQNKCVARREESPGREYEGLGQVEPFLCVFDRLNMTFVVAH